MTKISYPIRFQDKRLGRLTYPKQRGNISIFLSNILKISAEYDLNICKEISLTILEEIAHEYHLGRTPTNHDFEILLHSLPC